MDKGEFLGGLLLGISAGIVISVFLDFALTDPKLDRCAKEHNVYACEFVVVPVIDGG